MNLVSKDLPMLSELRVDSRHAYNFEVTDNLIQAKHLRDIESELQWLDAASWDELKRELIPLATKRDSKRGWQPLFDKLNEAKGYNYLVSIGCTEVKLIPRSPIEGQKTPDLQGRLGSTTVLCEVKTINISDAECASRKGDHAGTILARLPVEFFNKINSTLETARDQMAIYCPTTGTRKIAFVIINYDDILHEYASNYDMQLEQFLATKPVPDLEIVFDIKPPFYWATA
jgi:hypothetical protein